MRDTAIDAVTFLFTDIVNSSGHWDANAGAMRLALSEHDELMRREIAAADGEFVKHTGDGVMAAFPSVPGAIQAAVAAQLELTELSGGDRGAVVLEVRMGIHTGEAERRAGDYFGRSVTRAARLMGVAHGGQILVSEASAHLAAEQRLPPNIDLAQLGEIALKGVSGVERPRQVIHPRLRTEFPRPTQTRGMLGNLPIPLTALIGRGDDLERALTALSSSRLVTLSGYGGVGKTRLALEVAHSVQSFRCDGAWWVQLAPIRDASAIVHAAANALGIVGAARDDPLTAIVDACAVRDTLIVLDNCEHHVDESARLVRTLLERCPGVSVLATSRVPLRVPGECLIIVDPLDFASDSVRAESAAVQLFAERARSSLSTFGLSESNLDAVVAICEQLDGLPLAIELAAARVRSMTPAEIVLRLNDRFRLLDSGRSADDERHHSMLRTLEWSYELLSPPLQVAFDHLCLFAGDFDAAAAANMCGEREVDPFDVTDLLAQLVDNSMLSVAKRSDNAGVRYGLVETFREFGIAHLLQRGELGFAQERFARYWLSFSSAAHEGVKGRDEARWRRAIDADISNLRSAHSILVAAGDADGALQMVVDLYEYAFFGMHLEIGSWASAAVAMDRAANSRLWADGTAVAALLAWSGAAWKETETHLAALNARPELARPSGTYLVEFVRGLVAAFRGGVVEQSDQYELCQSIAAEDDDTFRLALMSGQLAFARAITKDPRAVETGERAVRIAETLGNPTALSAALWGLGITLAATDPRRASSLFVRAAEIARDAGCPLNESAAASGAVSVRDWTTSPLEELLNLLEQWELWRRGGANPSHWSVLRHIAFALMRAEEFAAVAVALGAEGAAQLQLPRSPGEQRRIEVAVATLEQRLGAEDVAQLQMIGAAMDPAELDRYVGEAAERAIADLRRQDSGD
ncbi:MAG TPA: adenylate/guanylate cyclase domain-containing protein [Acidimicrobiia bacterium]